MTRQDLPYIAKLIPVLTEIFTPRLAFVLVFLSSLVVVCFITHLLFYNSILLLRYHSLENELAFVSL